MPEPAAAVQHAPYCPTRWGGTEPGCGVWSYAEKSHGVWRCVLRPSVWWYQAKGMGVVAIQQQQQAQAQAQAQRRYGTEKACMALPATGATTASPAAAAGQPPSVLAAVPSDRAIEESCAG
eukprot:3824905-Rhodomonas_salina.1